MITQKIRTQTLFAIAFLLIGGFVLGNTIIPKAIGANISFTINGPASNLMWDPGADWDDHNVYSGVYISADRIGNNGSVIGSLSVSGGRYPIWGQVGQDWVVTDHQYVASAYAGGAKGKANARVQVPGEGVAHDQRGPGEHPVNWNNPNVDSSMDASDSCIRWEWGTGLRSMLGRATHRAEGAAVIIGFDASGI